MNPAGGLRYHWRASRYARQLWQPFRWLLGEWLLDWQPSETTLVLVGPSAGYNLQPFLFERFERIIALEPDPVARLIFKRRLGRAPLDRRPKLEFIRDDLLVASPERLPRLLQTSGNACVLFSNVIGQLPVLLGVTDPDSPQLSRVRDCVIQATAGRSWASFHDRMSGNVRPNLQSALVSDARLTDAELLSAIYSYAGTSLSLAAGELRDHFTSGFFSSDLPHAYFCWELMPNYFHLIEGVKAVHTADS
jgi:hypothetical protein